LKNILALIQKKVMSSQREAVRDIAFFCKSLFDSEVSYIAAKFAN
jgi:hypothetical protein